MIDYFKEDCHGSEGPCNDEMDSRLRGNDKIAVLPEAAIRKQTDSESAFVETPARQAAGSKAISKPDSMNREMTEGRER